MIVTLSTLRRLHSCLSRRGLQLKEKLQAAFAERQNMATGRIESDDGPLTFFAGVPPGWMKVEEGPPVLAVGDVV